MSRPYITWRKWLNLLSRSRSLGSWRAPCTMKPTRHHRRLRVETLEDRTLLSGFYTYDVIAHTGQAGLSGILADASINDAGEVAFVGQYQDKSGNPAGEGIFVGDGSSLNDISFSTYPPNPNRSYGPGVQINNNDEVAAVDRYSSGGGTDWSLRTWNADGQTNFFGNTWTTYANGSSPPTEGFDFDALASSVSLTNNGNVAYASFNYDASQWEVRLQHDTLPDPFDVPAVTLPTPQSLRPMATDGAGNQAFVVVREGSTATSPIMLYGNVPGGAFFSVPIAQAGTPYRFSALGQSPGVNDDGRVVVFYGVDAGGPGIFASVTTAGGGRQIERIASASANGPISAFDPDERVGVNDTETTQGAVTITYVAYDAKGNKGVYASRLTFIPPSNNPTDFPDATNFVVSDPIPVLQAGDTINGLGTVQDVQLYDPINSTGFGRIAIWVQGSSATGIVRATSLGLSAIANAVHTKVNGAAISASFQPMFYQYGKPPSPMTLGEVANALGVDHFNWVQYVTALPSSWTANVASKVGWTDPGANDDQPEVAPDQNNQLVTVDNPQFPDGTSIGLQPIATPLQTPGLLDPIEPNLAGGQTYAFLDSASDKWVLWDYSEADNQKGYYNDVSTPNLPATSNNVNLADQMTDSQGNPADQDTATQLQFFDEPQQISGTIPSGQYLAFQTALVGVRDDGTLLEFPKGLGVSFSWKSNAMKTSSGVSGNIISVSYSSVPSTNLPPPASGGVFDVQADNALPPADVLVLAPIDNQAVTPGTQVNFTAAAADPFPGATVTFSLAAGAPAGASIDPNTGAFTWTPTTA